MPVTPSCSRVLAGGLRAGSAGLVAALALTLLVPAADATPGTGVTSTTTVAVDAATTTSLAGLAVTTDDPQQGLEVTVSTDVGTLSITTRTGLTLAFGNSWSGQGSITFSGVASDLDAGLASTALTTLAADGGRTAHLGITALSTAAGVVYSPANQHFYQYVSAPAITQTAAVTDAAQHSFRGQQGYLASVPNATVNDLITGRLEGAANVWIGAESVDTPGEPVQRTWQWAYGPLAGQPVSRCANFVEVCDFVDDDGLYSSWAGGEPNNFGSYDGAPAHSGEWVVVTNYIGSAGEWNDFPPDIGGGAGGYVVEYGDLPTGASDFSGVVSDASDVRIDDVPATPSAPSAPSAPGAPTRLTGVGGDRTLTLTWTPPAVTGSPVTGYDVSLDDGRTWTPARTTGTGLLSTTVTGVRKTVTYPARVRAVNGGGAGPAGPRVDVAVPQWFADPASATTRAREVGVPRHPRRYHGPRRHTVATARARDGRPAYPAKALHGRQLQSGEAVSLLSRAMFRLNRTRLLPAGRRALRATVASLTYVDAVTCEGYADYGGRTAWERTLARRRARTVCARLRAYGADVVTHRVGYGSRRPVVIGGDRSDRAANRRVVIVVTHG